MTFQSIDRRVELLDSALVKRIHDYMAANDLGDKLQCKHLCSLLLGAQKCLAISEKHYGAVGIPPEDSRILSSAIQIARSSVDDIDRLKAGPSTPQTRPAKAQEHIEQAIAHDFLNTTKQDLQTVERTLRERAARQRNFPDEELADLAKRYHEATDTHTRDLCVEDMMAIAAEQTPWSPSTLAIERLAAELGVL